MYEITKHTREQAKRLGVEVRPSRKGEKKIDVFRGGQYLGSAGHKAYGDYGTFLEEGNRAHAEERRRLYRARHSEGEEGSPAYWAWHLLW